MVPVKLYIQDVKKMVKFKQFKATVFKSGRDVKLWCMDKNYEDKLIDLLHKKNFSCVPDMVPSNGFYTLILYM